MKLGRVIQSLQYAIRQGPDERWVSREVLKEAVKLIYKGKRAMGANDRQVAGNHYASSLQHWDVVEEHGIGYLEGCGSKYVSRWRKKGTPLQDLEKSLHFTDKTIELAMGGRGPRGCVPRDVIERFVIANDLEMEERLALLCLWRWSNIGDLNEAKRHIENIIREFKHAQGETSAG